MKKIQITTKKELLKIENMITVMKKVTGNVEYKFEKIPQKIEQKKKKQKKENRREISRKVEPSQEIQHLNNREEEERSNE